jgi:tetratricopeptide (TPR) repeat protein
MSVHKLEVFLASRFDEFAVLRRALSESLNKVQRPPVLAVNLDDNRAEPHPPLSRCYEAVDRAEIFVLLLGETYGDDAPGEERSFTHLEYLRALRDDTKIILPFLLGTSHDARMSAWIRGIQKNHCTSRLKSTDHAEAAIFESVLERLWEIFADDFAGPSDELDDGGEISSGAEESPIKLEQLCECRKSSSLRSIAADHAKEAFDAIRINLPNVAIHHLRQSAKLVPLDVIVSYWLARLLVARGRFKECKEGVSIALRCARIAAADDTVPKLAGMASLIVAARGKERLGDGDDALEYATAAHDAIPYHWLAKLELGRQLALHGKGEQATRFAREAFWLRPRTILQIQRDPAYRGLGREFEEFRDQLILSVSNEAQDIIICHAKIQNLAGSLGADETTTANVFEIDPEDRRHKRFLRLIEIGRRAAWQSLELLRACAAALLRGVESFENGGFKGLTLSTLTRLQEAFSAETLRITELTRQIAQESETAAHWRRKASSSLAIGAFVAIVLAGVAFVFLSNRELGGAVLGFLLLVVAIALTAERVSAASSNHSSTLANVRRLEVDNDCSKAVLRDLIAVSQQFKSDLATMQRAATTFCELVGSFERRAGRRVPFSPAVPIRRDTTSDIVVTSAEDLVDLGALCDMEIVPQSLRHVSVGEMQPTPNWWFARRSRSASGQSFSRAGVYFQ